MSNTKKNELKVLSPTAILGYGYPLESFMNGMAEKPDLIGVDAGSVDPGPYYLGAGKSFTNRSGVKRDLREMLKAAVTSRIPLVIGSAGGSGALPHLKWCREIIEELATEENLSFKMGVIPADIEKCLIERKISAGKTQPLGDLPELTAKTVRETTNIVAQMGTEPIAMALKTGCDVVLAGRTYDPAVFAAMPIMLGFDPGPAMHMGKILECAAIAAHPGSGADCVLGILRNDSFILKPLSDKRRFTRHSTAAHSLYEKSNPYHLPGPGGALDLSDVSFSELPNGMVEVRGSRFVKSEKYMIKLEGSRLVGFRALSFAGFRDPVMISMIDSIIEAVSAQAKSMLSNEKINGTVKFHVYGKNGIMEKMEPGKMDFIPREMSLIIESLAPSQEQADAVCSIVRSTMLHYGYEGRISTAGNLAFPFSPSDISFGPAYEFSIYHLMELENDDKIFPIETVTI